MAVIKDITMRQYNGTDYDTLYPKNTSQQSLLNDSALAEQFELTVPNPTVHDALEKVGTLGIVTLDNVYTTAPTSRKTDTTSLDSARAVSYASAAPLKNAGLFAGGVLSDGTSTNQIFKYDINGVLTYGSATLDTAKYNMASGTLYDSDEPLAFFTSGSDSGSEIYEFNNEMVKQTVAIALPQDTRYAGSAILGDYFVVAGGQVGTTSTFVSTVTGIYKTGDVRTDFTAPLSVAEKDVVGATSLYNGEANRCFFAGYTGSTNTNLDMYTSSAVKSVGELPSNPRNISATSASENFGYVIFAGGGTTTFSDSAFAYDYTGARTQAPNLSVARAYMATTGTSSIYTKSNYAYFVGGVTTGLTIISNTVDIYYDNLAHFASTLDEGRSYMVGVAFNGEGNMADSSISVFLGGQSTAAASSISNSIDIFTNNFITSIEVPPFCEYNFTGDYPAQGHTGISSYLYEAPEAVSGYIKHGGFTLSGRIN